MWFKTNRQLRKTIVEKEERIRKLKAIIFERDSEINRLRMELKKEREHNG